MRPNAVPGWHGGRRVRRRIVAMVTSPVLQGYNSEMRHFALMLVIAAALSACASAIIGPVDHSCAASAVRGQGSGCDDGGDANPG